MPEWGDDDDDGLDPTTRGGFIRILALCVLALVPIVAWVIWGR